ncbi:MAG: helix-turn-helix transcriptional regulator, partial [Verrucomicrobia bacterium]|nr:helix-turn-helix transcriptional regulator [Cytophagales bacterium]
EIRQKQEITMQEVAEAAQISKGMLSKIENGRTVPSLWVLLAIIAALGTDMSAFFEGIEIDLNRIYIHVKKEDYQPFEKENRIGFLYHSILSHTILSPCVVDVVMLDLMPNCQRKMVTTNGFELKYVVRGQITYQLGDDIVVINEGDTLFFDGRIPHVPMNKTDEKVTMLVVYMLFPETE